MNFYRSALHRFVQPAWLYCYAVIALIWVTYASVVWSNYAFYDDYVYLAAAQDKTWSGVYAVFMAGRPIAAVLLYWLFLAAGSIDKLWILRAVTLGGISLAAICTFRAFRQAGHPHFLSAAITAIIFLLPPFQVYVAWAQYFVVGPAICLAYLAYTCALKAQSTLRLPYKLLGVAATVLLLGIAAAIYQPLAMCYWFYLAIALTGPEIDQPALKQKLPFLASLGIGGAAFGYLIFRISHQFYPYPGAPNARFGFTTDIPAKLVWFVSEALRRVAGLNLLNSPGIVSILLGACAVIGLWLYCRNILKTGFQIPVLLGCCMLIAFAPNLISGENWASSRSLGVITMIWALLAFLAIRGFTSWRESTSAFPVAGGVMIVWLLFSVALASRNTSALFVLPQERELSFIKAGLVAPEFTVGKRLVFVQGNWSVQASPLPVSLYDEFGFASTGASYTAAQMLALLLPMVRPDVRIETVRYVDFGTPVNATEREYVLDMRGLKALIGKHSEFAHIGDELVPVQLSDTNWKKGIWINTAIRQDAGFFVYNSARNKQRLAEAATLVFDKSGPRKILSQDETAPYINIWVEGPPLDPEWDGYPHAIAIQK